MMNFNDILRKTAFNPIDITIDGVTFRVGATEEMPMCPLALSLQSVKYDCDGKTLGGIVFALSDIQRYLQCYGENFTKKFLAFIVGHEVGHLVNFKNDPPRFGGLNISVDREAEADAWAMSHTKTSVYLYRRFMKALYDEVERLNQDAIKAAAVVGVINKIDGFNYNRRIKAAIGKVKPGEISQEVTDIVNFVVEVTKKTYSK